jgi:uncharacterized SAM-binding protein YcdF (DUF218 family)
MIDSLFIAKGVALLLLPPALPLFLILWGLLRRRRGMAYVGVALLWLLSTPWVSSWLLWSLEGRYFPPPVITEVPKARYTVVLGGSVSAPRVDLDAVQFHHATDRLWVGSRLIKQDRAEILVFSGGKADLHEDVAVEADIAGLLLEDWGIPRERMLLEGNSRSTWGNAIETRRLLGENPGQIQLVTSALHMPRAEWTFRHVGFDLIAVPADFANVERPRVWPRWFQLLPSAHALGGSHAALWEWLGNAWYRLKAVT